MPKTIIALLLAAFALAACEPSDDIDLDKLERENREILRQLGGD